MPRLGKWLACAQRVPQAAIPGGTACGRVAVLPSARIAARRAVTRGCATAKGARSPKRRDRAAISTSISTPRSPRVDKQIDAVCAKADVGASDRAELALGLGLAGLSSPADAERVEARYAAFASVRAANDALAGCLGAHGGGDGALIIAGTGSAAVARVGGRETVIGGRGFLLGDDGSAARVGAEAIRAALRAHDGVGPASPLTEEVMRRFGDPLAATQWALTAKPAGYGAFMPLVFERAAAGDAVALTIVEAAARAIDALIDATRALGATRVVAGRRDEPGDHALSRRSVARGPARSPLRRRRRRDPHRRRRAA